MFIILLMCVAQIMSSLYGPSAVTNMQHAKVRDIWHWLLIFISLEGEAGHRVLKRWIYPNISQFGTSWTKHTWLYINIQYIWNPVWKWALTGQRKLLENFNIWHGWQIFIGLAATPAVLRWNYEYLSNTSDQHWDDGWLPRCKYLFGKNKAAAFQTEIFLAKKQEDISFLSQTKLGSNFMTLLTSLIKQ